MLLNPAIPLPTKEVLLEHVAMVNGAVFIALALAPIQIALGVKLFINGLQQKPNAYTISQTGITIPVNLEVMFGDVLHVQYHDAL